MVGMRKLLISLAALLLVAAGYAYWQFGPINGPSRAPPRDQWEALLRERIKLPEGYRLEIFARDLGRLRLMQMTENGDLIVSGYRDGSILLVKADGDGDGGSDGQQVLIEGANQPHGLLLDGATLYVAEEQRVVRYEFDGAQLENEQAILEGIPAGGGHSSRTLKRGPDGFLYVSVGSSCNACIEEHPWRAGIIRFKEGAAPELFASGLRNTVGFDWQPGTGALFGVDNGRDHLGDDVPDDEVNRIAAGQHYGWPYVHGAEVQDPSLYADMPPGLSPVPQFHGLGGHVAPLSIRFLRNQGDAALNGTALVAEHGSWNRREKAGYRIIRLVFDGDSVREEVFLSGCEVNGEVICRPVDILEAQDGRLFVSDDYAGAVYAITKTP
jgi:glucose/arabinose dehydrogenase